jgi:hypothetical protein
MTLEHQQQNIKDAERRLLTLHTVTKVVPPKPVDGALVHNITLTDTLAGIAIRYGLFPNGRSDSSIGFQDNPNPICSIRCVRWCAANSEQVIR